MRLERSMGGALVGLLVMVLAACGPGPGGESSASGGETPSDTAADTSGAIADPVNHGAGAGGLHALGQEPGWMVDITPGGELRVLARYGTDTITAPAPAPTRSPDGARVFRATTPEHAVTVTVTDEPCRDAMSGKPFPMTVTLELDGETFRGCGERGGAE